MISIYLRHKVVPGTIIQESELEAEPPRRRRFRGKTATDEDGVRSKAMDIENLIRFRGALQQGFIELLVAINGVKRPQLLAQGEAQPQDGYTTLAAFQHRRLAGIPNATKENSILVQKVAQLLSMVLPEEVSISRTVIRNKWIPIHKDSFNDRTIYNLVSLLNVASDTGTWQELRPKDQRNFISMEVKEKDVPGQLHTLKIEVRTKL